MLGKLVVKKFRGWIKDFKKNLKSYECGLKNRIIEIIL